MREYRARKKQEKLGQQPKKIAEKSTAHETRLEKEKKTAQAEKWKLAKRDYRSGLSSQKKRTEQQNKEKDVKETIKLMTPTQIPRLQIQIRSLCGSSYKRSKGCRKLLPFS